MLRIRHQYSKDEQTNTLVETLIKRVSQEQFLWGSPIFFEQTNESNEYEKKLTIILYVEKIAEFRKSI